VRTIIRRVELRRASQMANASRKRTSRPVGTRQSARPKAKGDAMSVQYLLVTYPGTRAVLADDAPVGFTNHVLMLPAGEYTITLDGNATVPPSQDVVLAGTSLVKPMVVAFSPAATAAGGTARGAA